MGTALLFIFISFYFAFLSILLYNFFCSRSFSSLPSALLCSALGENWATAINRNDEASCSSSFLSLIDD
jgi:hypothetical protein